MFQDEISQYDGKYFSYCHSLRENAGCEDGKYRCGKIHETWKDGSSDEMREREAWLDTEYTKMMGCDPGAKTHVRLKMHFINKTPAADALTFALWFDRG